MTAPTPQTSTLVRPFTVSIPDSEINDMKQRLARTRWPDPETVGDWSQGVRVENARSLVGYWERGYDWRRFESGLNRFPQFLTGLDRRVPEADRPADRSGFVRRRRRRFIRRRRPVAPRVRVLPEAHGDRVDCIAHRKRVGGADEASRLHEMVRARRRLGCRRHHRPRGHAT